MKILSRQELAAKGEAEAQSYLIKKNYRILAQNFRCSLGEIDLVAEEKGAVIFIEVKTRTSRLFGEPEEAVTHLKQKKLGRLAEFFLKQHNLNGKDVRFDVISVLSNLTGGSWEISHFENAIEF